MSPLVPVLTTAEAALPSRAAGGGSGALIPFGEYSSGGEQERAEAFRPPFCPNPCCTLHHGPPEPDAPHEAGGERGGESDPWFREHGHYRTKVRGLVQRFRCRRCHRCFSTQSFSTSCYLKVELPLPLLYLCLVGGMSLRALSRTLGCTPASLSNRIGRLARQAITMLEMASTLEQALHDREITDEMVHHSDRGSQYLSIRYTDRLAEVGIAPSVGSAGDSYDNAMAESIIGLYKTEVIRRYGPWKSIDAVEIATLDWVDWYNNRRIMEPIGYRSPREAEMEYYQQRMRTADPVGLTLQPVR